MSLIEKLGQMMDKLLFSARWSTAYFQTIMVGMIGSRSEPQTWATAQIETALRTDSVRPGFVDEYLNLGGLVLLIDGASSRFWAVQYRTDPKTQWVYDYFGRTVAEICMHTKSEAPKGAFDECKRGSAQRARFEGRDGTTWAMEAHPVRGLLGTDVLLALMRVG